MKLSKNRWILPFALLALIATAAIAQQGDVENPSASSDSAPDSQKNGTGVVPPGVKLVPQMPSAGAPQKPFHFPQAAMKTASRTACGYSWSPITANRPLRPAS